MNHIIKVSILVIFILFVVITNLSFQEAKPVFQYKSLATVSNLQTKQQVDMSFFKRNLNVVALGDSLTKGMGDTSGKGGYVGEMSKELSRNPYIDRVEINNLGIVGLRSDQLLQKVEQENFQVPLKQADVIFLTIGGNDLVQIVQNHFFTLSVALFEKERQQYEQNVNETITKIRAINQDATIYAIGLFNPFAQTLVQVDELNSIIASWNAAIVSMVNQSSHMIYVPIDDIFREDMNLLYKDQFHPNSEGYAKIGGRVFTYLTEHNLPHDHPIFADY